LLVKTAFTYRVRPHRTAIFFSVLICCPHRNAILAGAFNTGIAIP
jgi:hypothetical protein